MDIKYMLACILMSMGPAKHEQAAIFRRKMRGLRMFSSILGVRSTKKSTSGSFVPWLITFHQLHIPARFPVPLHIFPKSFSVFFLLSRRLVLAER